MTDVPTRTHKLHIVDGKKQPVQQRAQQTVFRILAAAGALLESENYQEVTTNHIAKRANVAISSLYQYFPDKNSVYLSLYHDTLYQTLGSLTSVIHSVRALPLEEAFPPLIEQWLNIFEKQRYVLLQMPEQQPELNIPARFPSLSSLLYDAGRRYLGDANADRRNDKKEMAIYFLHKVNYSAMRHYILRDSRDIDRQTFIDELAQLSSIYLRERLAD